ncbi:hypothetical protein HIM_03100 [Hirsutella minnesotensis 3608]|nr:hypothetical protein HIM_03100 [Hirsutella minnesotensis 3608]
MDKLFSAGKDFLDKQNSSQGQGSHGNNNNHHGFGDAPQEASRLAGSSGDSGMFSQIMGAIGQRKDQLANEDYDEEDAARKHKQAYNDNAHGDENSLGAAAAMQAFKMFNSQDGKSSDKGASGGGGQGAFLAMAMSEASKLFDDKASSGKVPAGASKESTIQKAGEMAMKMYFKNQAKKQGGLAGLASQFMK